MLLTCNGVYQRLWKYVPGSRRRPEGWSKMLLTGSDEKLNLARESRMGNLDSVANPKSRNSLAGWLATDLNYLLQNRIGNIAQEFT